jgi:cytochrome P450
MDVAQAVGLLLTPAGRDDPYPTYDVLRAHGPLTRVDERFFVATGYTVIAEALRDSRLLVHDHDSVRVAGLTPGRAVDVVLTSMLQRNAPDHTRMRRLAASAFTPRRVAEMRGSIAARATTLADALAERSGPGREPVDFMDEFAYPLPVQIICTLLGVPGADEAWFRERAGALTVVIEQTYDGPAAAAADAAADELTRYFVELVAERRRQPCDDLTTALVQAHDADDASDPGDDELLANLILLLVAGFETTTNLLGNGLLALLERPALADALRADPSLAPAYVEEVLRYDSPVQVTSRWNLEPMALAGHDLPDRSEVLLLLGAGNRDPERFAGPARFDPARVGNQPLSFGAGPHYCLGAALARLEGQVAFPVLLERLPKLALAGVPQRRDRLTLRGYASLPVTPG